MQEQHDTNWTIRPDDANGWKQVDIMTGDDSIRAIDPEQRVVFPQGAEPGHKLKLVRVEEVWATDPATGACMDKLSQQTYIRECSKEEQEAIEAEAYAKGVLLKALSQHFN